MFSERLKQLRMQRQLSQNELAKRSGIHLNMIQRYEDGKSNPTADSLYKLCRELQVSSDYLIGLTDQPNERTVSPDNLDAEALKVLSALESENAAALIAAAQDLLDKAKSKLPPRSQ